MRLSFEQRQNIGWQYVCDTLEPRTPFGRDLLKKATPYTRAERGELERELDNVALIVAAGAEDVRTLDGILRLMGRMKDVRRTVERCALGSLGEVDLFELRHFTLILSELKPLADALSFAGRLHGIAVADVDEVLRILDPEGNRMLSFYIEDSRTPELLAARREKRRLDELLRAGATGSEKDALSAARTVAAAREENAEQAVRNDMCEKLRPHLAALERSIGAIGRLDLCIQKARAAARFGAVRPVITDARLSLRGAFNPRIKQLCETRGTQFTALSIAPPAGVTVVTGANMGGKSVALKTVALNAYMAAMGFFVFALEAEIPLFDGIYIISEDLEASERGLSSFGGEIVRFGEVCDEVEKGEFALIIMDEFARGTNSREGAAIVRATVKYLQGKNCVAILATHYDGAAVFAAAHYQTAGLRGLDLSAAPSDAGVAYIAKHMDYGLYPVPKEAECPRDAVAICRLLNMRAEILREIDTEA